MVISRMRVASRRRRMEAAAKEEVQVQVVQRVEQQRQAIGCFLVTV